jgi:hypothetical protein
MPGARGGIEADELRAFFRAVEAGEIRLVAESEPQDVYAGNVIYRASNGWTLVVFNDANEYDYVDHVVTDDGRIIDFDDGLEELADWVPNDDVAWRCLGIPGYCSFRCNTCGARLPDGVERGGPVVPPFVCGTDRCVGRRVPAEGTWIRVESP